MNYGELLKAPSFCPTSDSFGIIHPTAKLPFDEILMEAGGRSEAWPIPVYRSQAVSTIDRQSHGVMDASLAA